MTVPLALGTEAARIRTKRPGCAVRRCPDGRCSLPSRSCSPCARPSPAAAATTAGSALLGMPISCPTSPGSPARPADRPSCGAAASEPYVTNTVLVSAPPAICTRISLLLQCQTKLGDGSFLRFAQAFSANLPTGHFERSWTQVH